MNMAFPSSPTTALLALVLLGGCGSGGGGSGTDPAPVDRGGAAAPGAEPDGPVFADPVVVPPGVPAPLLAIEASPGRLAPVPSLLAIETLADSGLQVAYTERSQRMRIEPSRVGLQWQHMQGCVEVVSPPPLVLVRIEVEPFGTDDDVIRDIEGRISASASVTVDGTAVLQVSDAPFDGSRADAGFGLLRQIMGRYLWLSDGQPERTYPAGCAREVPPDAAPDPAFHPTRES